MSTTTLRTDRQREQGRCLRWMDIDGVAVRYVHGTAAIVRALWRAADSGGIIQNGHPALLRAFPGQPERHGTTFLGHALSDIGAASEYMIPEAARSDRDDEDDR